MHFLVLQRFPLFTANVHLLVLLLLLLHQLVDLPLGHAGVLRDDAVLVQAGQQQQEAHCNEKNKKKCAKIFNRTLRALKRLQTAPDEL